MNISEQLKLLKYFSYSEEFEDFVLSDSPFFFGNGSFEGGDAEYLYNFIRHFKPQNIIEVGCGNSTLIINEALKHNSEQNQNCNHISIEPFEAQWLESYGVKTYREKIELIDLSYFNQLESGDFLFIDSSHIIRPQGDVIFEVLEILPNLKKGVFVHFHDVFSPNDYPEDWVFNKVRFWNEQYLLEAFLSNNDSWRIIGALNLLNESYKDEFKKYF